MLLADYAIREAVAEGLIGITPWDPTLVQPASVDVRLGREFQLMSRGVEPIDPRQDSARFFLPVVAEDGAPLYLEPGGFALASTYEHLTLPDNLVARVEGKSSLARLGIQIHATAGYIDPSFTGTITLEISNLAPRPALLWPGMKIGQLAFEYLNGSAERPYGSHGLASRYQGQSGPTCSRIHLGFTHGLPPVEPVPALEAA